MVLVWEWALALQIAAQVTDPVRRLVWIMVAMLLALMLLALGHRLEGGL